jgi:general L-amino acid transport system permease protein
MTASIDSMKPPQAPGILKWIQKNLFNSWPNSILTLAMLLITIFALKGAIGWIINTADWRPVVNFPILYLVGQFPRDQLWRIGLSAWLLSLMFGVSWGIWGNLIRPFALSLGALFGLVALWPFQTVFLEFSDRFLLLLNLPIIFLGFSLHRFKKLRSIHVAIGWLVTAFLISVVLLSGVSGIAFLPRIPTTLWGGLLITFLLAAGGIIISFPIAVLLALGRRSKLPVVKTFCVVFIETIRGVPLITILFMFSVLIQLILPEEARIDRLVRALIGMTVFSAAYTAENVRGGLAAVSPGQVEAAKAVGMNSFQITLLIVLPQAIRAVIPSIVGQFISLFKDTTLVLILGINELLGIGKAIINSTPEFIRLQGEVYIFIAVVYWSSSSVMSYASRQLEAAMGVGKR